MVTTTQYPQYAKCLLLRRRISSETVTVARIHIQPCALAVLMSGWWLWVDGRRQVPDRTLDRSALSSKELRSCKSQIDDLGSRVLDAEGLERDVLSRCWKKDGW